MDLENINNIITRKIRIYPTKKQKIFFNKCFGVTRYIYNNIVNYVNTTYKDDISNFNKLKEKGCIFDNCCKDIHENSKYFCKKHIRKKIKYSFDINRISLRNRVLVNDKDLTEDNLWQKEVPYDTRQLIIDDFCTAYKTCITNRRNNNINYFNFRFKTKKDTTQIFHINKKALTKELELFKRRKIGKLRVRKKMRKWLEKNIKEIECNCKIIRYNPNQYYLLLSIKKKIKYKKADLGIVSLDPGVRSFQTFYSSDGICGKIGYNFKNKLKNINKKIDNLKSVHTKIKNKKTKKNLRNRIFLLRTKIKNMISDLHWKTINFLCKYFNIIILPNFETSNMTEKKNRNIGKDTVKELLSLNHYKFKLRLKYKCEMLGRKLLLVDESYTSKTCGNCGNINNNLGNDKIYSCSKCNYNIDRDLNGARNILLKHL